MIMLIARTSLQSRGYALHMRSCTTLLIILCILRPSMTNGQGDPPPKDCSQPVEEIQSNDPRRNVDIVADSKNFPLPKGYVLPSIAERYLNMVRYALMGSLYKGQDSRFVSELAQKGNYWPGPCAHTMIGFARLDNIRHVVEETLRGGVEGGFAELGVWRGGAGIFAAALYKAFGVKRDVYLMDVFGLLIGSDNYSSNGDYLAVTSAEVRQNFENYDLLDESVHLLEGLSEDTLEPFIWANPDFKLAVLRVDCNFYQCHMDAFFHLLPKVQPGGYVIFDDLMSHHQVQVAWNDFTAWHPVCQTFELIIIDDHGAYLRVTERVEVDWSKYTISDAQGRFVVKPDRQVLN